jgi:hypothetical protein
MRTLLDFSWRTHRVRQGLLDQRIYSLSRQPHCHFVMLGRGHRHDSSVDSGFEELPDIFEHRAAAHRMVPVAARVDGTHEFHLIGVREDPGVMTAHLAQAHQPEPHQDTARLRVSTM